MGMVIVNDRYFCETSNYNNTTLEHINFDNPEQTSTFLESMGRIIDSHNRGVLDELLMNDSDYKCAPICDIPSFNHFLYIFEIRC